MSYHTMCNNDGSAISNYQMIAMTAIATSSFKMNYDGKT